MKREITPPSRGLLIIYRLLVALFLVIIIIVIAGNLYAFFRSPDSPPLFRIGSGKGQSGQSVVHDESASVFSRIGRLRIPLAGEPASTIILSISFPYPSDDFSFAEELTARTGDFRSIANLYFAALPRSKIANFDEEAAKAEILERYNALLRLGKIETLYFGDLMIVE